MHEVIYLSDAKLERFLPRLRSLWPRPKIGVRPPFGSLDLDLAPDAKKARLQHLKKVVDEIGLDAKWFTDPNAQPGQWVQFEAPLNYVILSEVIFTQSERLSNMLMFID